MSDAYRMLDRAFLRGTFCHVCGKPTLNQSVVHEPDDHVAHILCKWPTRKTHESTEENAARLLREGRY
jgi:hypothetical protein